MDTSRHTMQRLTRATLLGVTLALTTPLVACKEKVAPAPVQQEVMLNVTTVDLQGKPVESVRFYINGKKFGITDQDGKFVGKYGAKNGDTLTFNVEAPELAVKAPVETSEEAVVPLTL